MLPLMSACHGRTAPTHVRRSNDLHSTTNRQTPHHHVDHPLHLDSIHAFMIWISVVPLSEVARKLPQRIWRSGSSLPLCRPFPIGKGFFAFAASMVRSAVPLLFCSLSCLFIHHYQLSPELSWCLLTSFQFCLFVSRDVVWLMHVACSQMRSKRHLPKDIFTRATYHCP